MRSGVKENTASFQDRSSINRSIKDKNARLTNLKEFTSKPGFLFENAKKIL